MDTTPPPTPDALLRRAEVQIDRIEARLLLGHALQKPQAWLYAHGDEALSADVIRLFDALVSARAQGQPVAYLTGCRNFWSLALKVTTATLIPRPETERLVELALERLPTGAASRIADLGTGSGAIALAIASERPSARVIATDASPAALEVARANAAAHALANVEFRHGSWFEPLQDQFFDLIASNPPYVADGDPHLAQGDLRFEPAAALASGNDGLDAVREIIAATPRHLHDGGWLLLEHGWNQGPAIRELMQQAGFIDIETALDLEHRERVTMGRKRT